MRTCIVLAYLRSGNVPGFAPLNNSYHSHSTVLSYLRSCAVDAKACGVHRELTSGQTVFLIDHSVEVIALLLAACAMVEFQMKGYLLCV